MNETDQKDVTYLFFLSFYLRLQKIAFKVSIRQRNIFLHSQSSISHIFHSSEKNSLVTHTLCKQSVII